MSVALFQRPVPPEPTVAVVAPDAVPPGAAVLGVVVLLPPAVPVPPAPADLRAVPAAPDGDDPDEAGPAPGWRTVRPGLVLDPAGRRVVRDGEHLDLTRREFDLFAHLTDRPGRVLTREHLLASVWGHADPRWTGPRTVDVHVARLRRKLGDRHGPCVQTVRGVGYRWVP